MQMPLNELPDPDNLLSRLDGDLSRLQQNDLRQELTGYINYLLVEDFNRLVQLLYRVDVSEQKLKSLLQEQPGTDAAVLIADLIIKRQEEKRQSRGKSRGNDIPEEERW